MKIVECREMKTLLCRYGTYKFEVCPFWLMNTPQTFHKMLGGVLPGLPFAVVHVYDVDILSKSKEEHVGHRK